MRRLITGLGAMAASAALITGANAQDESTTFDVTAEVEEYCEITAPDLNIGVIALDGVGATRSSAAGDIVIECTAGTGWSLTLTTVAPDLELTSVLAPTSTIPYILVQGATGEGAAWPHNASGTPVEGDGNEDVRITAIIEEFSSDNFPEPADDYQQVVTVNLTYAEPD